MANFNDQLQRMKGLMTYGAVNEKKENKGGAMEYHSLGADGKSYGIIRENQKFYIKVAPKSKEMVVEAYEYIGGFNNKKAYEYTSYSNALKNFELKMMSINEAYNPKVNMNTQLFEANGEVMTEGTKEMMSEIARQRQIMNNVAAILNESSTISCKNTGVPEAPKTSGFNAKIGEPFNVTAKAELDGDFKKTAEKPEKQGEPFGDSTKPEKEKDAQYVPSGSVANQKPKGGKVVKVNEIATRDAHEKYFWRIPEDKYYEIVSQYQPEDVEGHLRRETKDALREYLQQNRVDESTKKIWEMMAKLDKSFTLNESCDEWGSCGLPSSEGVGSPDGHLMESDEDIAGFADDNFEDTADEMNDVEPESEFDDEDFGNDEESFDEDEFSFDVEDDEEDFDDEEMPEDEFGDDEDFEDEADFDAEEDMDMDVDGDGEIGGNAEVDALRAEIEQLKSELAELKGEEMPEDEFGDEEGFEGEDEGFYADPEELGDEEDFDDEEMPEDEFGDDEDFDEAEMEDGDMDEEFNPETDAQYDEFDESMLDGIDDEEMPEDEFGISESRKAQLMPIIENLVKTIKNKNSINEEGTKLNDFGKHPGYRKKPMNLPATGSDNENGMKDWNDESVYSEQPFGSKIGDSAPFDKVVKAVTDSVMEAITGKKKI